MPVKRTHRGARVAQRSAVRNRFGWLRSLLLLGIYGLSGCTSGLAEPVSAPDGGDQKTAGRAGGAAGRGGRGGNDMLNPTCQGIMPWSMTLANDENTLGDLLNSQLSHTNFSCADKPLMRRPFDIRDELRCFARACAYSQELSKTSGCQNVLWLPQTPFKVLTISMTTRVSMAWDVLITRGDFCDALALTSYSAVGIGHYGSTWVIVLAKTTDSRP
jgi:hypothetical protein